jgi:rhodanese-related sulfurtransferase
MMTISAERAAKYFEDKMEFTTGPVELNEMMKRGEKMRVVDVRRQEDFAKGHIPGAINMPKGTWGNTSRLSRENVNVVYCYSEVCHLAASAARELACSGYPVMELEGGWETWERFRLPVER